MKTPVAERALLARVNRRLAKDGKTLRRNRPTDACFKELGRFTLIDTGRGAVVEHHVDLETLARQLGVLESWEEIQND